MPPTRDTSLIVLKNHVLVFNADTLHIYTDTLKLVHQAIPFPLSNLDLLSVNGNLLISSPTPSTIAVNEFDLDPIGRLKPPVEMARWEIPAQHKISVACWAVTESEEHSKQHALLGTRDGTILRLDLGGSAEPSPLFINGSAPDSQHSSTISCITAAPCGDGVYAVGYTSGPIVLYQEKHGEGLSTLHNISMPTKVQSLSWHYSSKNKDSQSLAVIRDGSDRLQVWTVDLMPGSTAPRKIRDIPLPNGHSIPSLCVKFLKWSKSGKVTRVSDSGLIVSDVRTKRVVTRFIQITPPVVSLDVKSTRGIVWVIDSANKLLSYSLMDGNLLDSIRLPFSVMHESAAILDSPVVFLHRPTQVTKIVYKNKKAVKSSVNVENPASNNNSDHQLRGSPVLVPGNVSSASSSTVDIPKSYTPPLEIYKPPVQLSLKPVKAVVNSLFPAVLKSLSRIPKQQLVPEFLPSMTTQDQYLISALFGGAYNTSLCLGGINDILQHSINKDQNSFRSLTFSLFLNDLSISQLVSTLQMFPGKKRFTDKLVITLLSIGSIAGNTRDSTTESTASSSSVRFCNKDLVNVVLNMLNDSDNDDVSSDDVHLICAYMVSMGYYLEAKQIYITFHYFLEALVVCLLCKADVSQVMTKWTMYLRDTHQHTNLLNYLSDLYTNITVVQRHQSETSSESLDDTSLDEQLAAYAISGVPTLQHAVEPPNLSTYTHGQFTGSSTGLDDVTIFSPDGANVPEDYALIGKSNRQLSSGLQMSASRGHSGSASMSTKLPSSKVTISPQHSYSASASSILSSSRLAYVKDANSLR